MDPTAHVSAEVKVGETNYTVILSAEDNDLAEKRLYIQRAGKSPTAFFLDKEGSHTLSTVVAERVYGQFDRSCFVTRALNGDRLDARRENISLLPRGMRLDRELERGIYKVERKSGGISYCVAFKEATATGNGSGNGNKRKSRHFRTLEEARQFRRENYLNENPLYLLEERRAAPPTITPEVK